MIIKEIYTRRSIRKYTDKTISEDIVNELIKAAMAAPSSKNAQATGFIVINDKNILKSLAEIHQHAPMIAQSNKSITVLGDLSKIKEIGRLVCDCSAATENILIQATHEGIGSCWCSVYPVQERMIGFKSILNLPDHFVPISIVALGYPNESKEPITRFDKERIWYNKYQQ